MAEKADKTKEKEPVNERQKALDTALAVTADTVAMSTPHEIDYTLTFDSATLAAAE